MSRPPVDVAEIFQRYGPAYRETHGASLSPNQRRVMQAIETCRTAALGGHVEECDGCGHRQIAYNSCRNRHCPKCQSLAKAAWLEARQADLLPVPYFHVIFTLPPAIQAIAYQNQAVVYGLLFRAVAETLRSLAADPKHLGAEIGFIALLHTWGQTLQYHPHVHCLVPGGGLAPDGQHWISCRPTFFLHVHVLAARFRRVFLDALQNAFAAQRLQFFGALAPLADRQAFTSYLAPLREAKWIAYAKPPFGSPQKVLDYLGRYTHRVAIANHRLVKLENDQVSFHWRDYRHHGKRKLMTLPAEEFIRRFLLHVLPTGFQRIRHYGLLANRSRQAKLARCRQLLAVPLLPIAVTVPQDARTRCERLLGRPVNRCPRCQQGRLVRVEVVPRSRVSRTVPRLDSS